MPSTVLAMWYDDPTTTDPSRLAPARQACSAAPASASAQFDRGGGGALTEKIRNAHEQELMKAMGVSRTVVREAWRRCGQRAGDEAPGLGRLRRLPTPAACPSASIRTV